MRPMNRGGCTVPIETDTPNFREIVCKLARADSERPQKSDRLSLSMLIPGPPTAAVHPGMACALCPKWKEHVVFTLSTIAPPAAVRR